MANISQEVKWIKIIVNIFDDEKMKLIDAMPDSDTVLVIWFKILALAGKSNHSGILFFADKIPYTDEMLSTIFNRKLEVVRYALKIFSQFGMVEIEDNVISVINWEKHQNIDSLQKIKEQNRLRQSKFRENQKDKLLEKNNVTKTLCSKSISKSNSLSKDTNIGEDEIQNLFIKTVGRTPKLPEQEKAIELINEYGYDVVFKTMKQAVLQGWYGAMNKIEMAIKDPSKLNTDKSSPEFVSYNWMLKQVQLDKSFDMTRYKPTKEKPKPDEEVWELKNG